MITPPHWEIVAQERIQDKKREMKYRQVLADLPPKQLSWPPWVAGAVIWMGFWLMS